MIKPDHFPQNDPRLFSVYYDNTGADLESMVIGNIGGDNRDDGEITEAVTRENVQVVRTPWFGRLTPELSATDIARFIEITERSLAQKTGQKVSINTAIYFKGSKGNNWYNDQHGEGFYQDLKEEKRPVVTANITLETPEVQVTTKYRRLTSAYRIIMSVPLITLNALTGDQIYGLIQAAPLVIVANLTNIGYSTTTITYHDQTLYNWAKNVSQALFDK